MLINLSNHPSTAWQPEQIQAAATYGNIVDLPFPDVDANENEEYIRQLADIYLGKVKSIAGIDQATIHLMGEMTLTMSLLKRLQKEGYTCIASTAQRVVTELPDHKTIKTFRFVRFRQYE